MNALLRPLMRSWATARSAAAGPAVLPAGEPVVAVEGPDPDRVLIVGGSPAAGVGATDHGAALPGALARRLGARTGRGAVVEARGRPWAQLDELPAMVRGAQLQRFDALVVLIGMQDGVLGVPQGRWRRALAAFVDDLHRDGARDAVVVLVQCPPASSTPTYRGAPALLADRTIRGYNRAITGLARQRDGLLTTPLPVPHAAGPAGSGPWYERCGDELAAVLHDRFAADRGAQDR